MRHLHKYNTHINENKSDNDVDDIVEILLDILENNNVTLSSPSGDMKYRDYMDKNNKYDYFKPVFKSGNKIRNKFKITIHTIDNYTRLLSIMDEMSAAIGRLGDKGWSMVEMKIGTIRPPFDVGVVKFSGLTYDFSKPDIILDTNHNISKKDIIDAFYEIQLDTSSSSIDISDNTIEVGFDLLDYSGELPFNLDDKFDKMCDKLGLTSYEYRNGDYEVTFYID